MRGKFAGTVVSLALMLGRWLVLMQMVMVVMVMMLARLVVLIQMMVTVIIMMMDWWYWR